MTVTAIHLNTYGTALEVDIDTSQSPYDVTRGFLGGWAEKVNILQVGDKMLTMWVDEEGHLKNLPVNELASQFYPAPGNPAGLPPGDPPIVGDVLFMLMELTPEPDWRAVDLNDEAREALRRQGVTA